MEAASAVASLMFSCHPEEQVHIPTDSTTQEDDDDSVDREIAAINQKVLRWVCDDGFKEEQLRLNIPDDPVEWTVGHVKHWIQVKFNVLSVQ